MERERGEFTPTDDPDAANADFGHAQLSTSYWAADNLGCCRPFG